MISLAKADFDQCQCCCSLFHSCGGCAKLTVWVLVSRFHVTCGMDRPSGRDRPKFRSFCSDSPAQNSFFGFPLWCCVFSCEFCEVVIEVAVVRSNAARCGLSKHIPQASSLLELDHADVPIGSARPGTSALQEDLTVWFKTGRFPREGTTHHKKEVEQAKISQVRVPLQSEDQWHQLDQFDLWRTCFR